MKKILLLNFGSLGDVHPFIGMGLALQKAGFEVRMGSNPAHIARIEAAGIPAFGVGLDLRPDDPALISAVMDPARGPEILHRQYIFPGTEEALRHTLPWANEADLILTGMLGYFVPTIAEITQKPWGMAMLAPIAYWSAYDPPETPAIPFLRSLSFLGPGFIKNLYKVLFGLGASWSAPLHRARKKRSLAKQANPMLASTMTSGQINLALFSKHFAPPQPDWPKTLIQPGFISYDGPGEDAELSEEIKNFLASGEPPVLMTLGSTNIHTPGQIFDIFIEALTPLKKRGLLLVGKSLLAEYRQKFSSPQWGIFDYAPYGKLIPQCAAVVHQGGVGTSARCLKAGKPSVIVGSANDQLDNARHVEEIGAGIKLPLKKLTQVSLSAALTRCFEPSLIKSSQAIGTLISSEKPEEAVVRAIEDFFRRSPAH